MKEEVIKCYCGHTITCDCGPKEETLEEAAREYWRRGQFGLEKAADTERAFLKGAKWKQQRMYSEEEVLDILIKLNDSPFEFDFDSEVEEWFEQFKKK